MKQWRIIGRHNHWVEGARITETLSLENNWLRRFTATIEGFQNWRIWQGDVREIGIEGLGMRVVSRVKQIRDRIRNGDESVFSEKGAW